MKKRRGVNYNMEEQRESKQTRPLFDKACNEIKDVLDAGTISDREYVSAIMQVFTGHIKIVNAERSKDALKFAVSQSVTENVDAMKEAIKQQLPEYVA